MLSYDFDLLVLGGGSGGVAAARRAAEYGAKVAICEDRSWGGTCVHRGCVPKKLLLYAANFGSLRETMLAYGWDTGGLRHDWGKLRAHLHQELERLEGFYQRMLAQSNVETLAGRGMFRDAHTIEVNGQSYTAERILVAVGGVPWHPPGLEGHEHAMSSDDVFWLETLPQDVLVVGSGYIGTEFAGIFHGLGVNVHVSFGSEHVLPGFDYDLRAVVEQEMEKSGIVFHRAKRPERLAKVGADKIEVTFTDGESLEVQSVLLATGRTPRTQGIGLEAIGVKLGDDGRILTDRQFQTSVANIFAIGDCTKRIELTPVAIAEGRQLAEHLFHGQSLDFCYSDVATAVFSSPPAASVGWTEDSLRGHQARCDVYRAKFRPMKYSLPGGTEQALIKVLVDPGSDRLLGAHLVGESAPELIQIMAALLKAQATMAMLRQTMAVHPTFAEEIVLFRKPSESIGGLVSALDLKQEKSFITLHES